jgi:hypothetical protein
MHNLKLSSPKRDLVIPSKLSMYAEKNTTRFVMARQASTNVIKKSESTESTEYVNPTFDERIELKMSKRPELLRLP